MGYQPANVKAGLEVTSYFKHARYIESIRRIWLEAVAQQILRTGLVLIRTILQVTLVTLLKILNPYQSL